MIIAQKDVVKNIVTVLRKISELDKKFIRNATSLYGADLEKQRLEWFESLEQDDLCIIFEVKDEDNDDDVSMSENSGLISYFKSKIVKLTIYGNDSSNLAEVIRARFLTESTKLYCQNLGLYAKDANNPTSMNEFVNEIMWHRSDLTLKFACHFSIINNIESIEVDSIDFNTKEI